MCFRSLLILFSILLVFVLSAQDDFGIPSLLPYQMLYPANTAPSSGSLVEFNVDILDTLNEDLTVPMAVTSSKLYISTDGQASWTDYNTSLDGSTGYEGTYEYNWTSNSNFHYYYQFKTDSTISTQSPRYTGSSFPAANFLVNIHDDPAGDDATITVDGTTYDWTNSDLRNFKMSYSNTSLAFQITTQGGLDFSHTDHLRSCGFWPLTYEQYVNFYHLYAAPILNPAAPYPDSIFYAIIYGDFAVSFLGIGIDITPGVYKIVTPGPDAGMTEYLDAYEKISTSSNFGYTTSGNTVSMWCDQSVLTSDPDFGDFPEDGGFITGCGIVTLALWNSECAALLPDTFAYVVHDFSSNTVFYMETQEDELSGNIAFGLGTEGFAAWDDSIRITVPYTDDDNNQPFSRQLQIGGCYPMTFDMYSYDHVYDDESVFQYTVTGDIPHKVPYRFIFSDGFTWTTTAWDTFNTGLTTLDITVNNALDATLDFGEIDCEDILYNTGSDTLNITNNGPTAIDLGIRVVSIDGDRVFWIGDLPAIDTFAVSLMIDDDSPGLSPSFDNIQNRMSDVVEWCDGFVFGRGGYNILPQCYNSVLSSNIEKSEKLYFKISAPFYASEMTADMSLVITIEVSSRVHLP